ncbi:MAG: FAD-dependent oxidoreductase [Thermodesulfobacteriota bacterium]|nr:FAD-dependent oxidoreductase [Thermodesulfobacteriota bacterium]
MGIDSAQVVVIGGGVIGTSITYYLAKQGLEVALFERADIASGTSGACSAAIAMQTKGSGLKLRLGLESKTFYESLSDELGEDVEYEQDGGMIIAETEEEVEYISSLVKRQREMGLSLRLLETREIKELQPAFSESVIASTFCPMDGTVNPLKVTFAYARAARRYGARLHTFAGVSAIKVSKGKVTEVTTDMGTTRTELIVNAAGVWAPEVGRMVGLRIPITPRRGILAVTEVLPPVIRGSILSAKYLMSKYTDGSGDGFTCGLTIRHTRAGNLLFGSSREFVGYNGRTTYGGISLIVREAIRVFPFLKDVCIIRTFAGLRPFTSDGLPIVGQAPGVEGLIMAAGHEGDGISLAPITGKLVANLITKGECPEVLSHLNLQRLEHSP